MSQQRQVPGLRERRVRPRRQQPAAALPALPARANAAAALALALALPGTKPAPEPNPAVAVAHAGTAKGRARMQRSGGQVHRRNVPLPGHARQDGAVPAGGREMPRVPAGVHVGVGELHGWELQLQAGGRETSAPKRQRRLPRLQDKQQPAAVANTTAANAAAAPAPNTEPTVAVADAAAAKGRARMHFAAGPVHRRNVLLPGHTRQDGAGTGGRRQMQRVLAGVHVTVGELLAWQLQL